MATRAQIACWMLGAGVFGACDTAPVDPPLPAPKFEIAPAPPAALGAKAAGTDAAPAPPEEEANPFEPEGEEPPHGNPGDGKPEEASPGSGPEPDAGGLPL